MTAVLSASTTAAKATAMLSLYSFFRLGEDEKFAVVTKPTSIHELFHHLMMIGDPTVTGQGTK
jgi:hypothetical protein